MHVYAGLALWGVVAFAIFKAVSYVLYHRNIAGKSSTSKLVETKAQEAGCQEPPDLPDVGFGGLNELKSLQRADKEKLFPNYLAQRERMMSEVHGREVSTWKMTVLFQKQFFTSDPRNIQAILATKFQDFGLGAARRGNFLQTLGDGIFVQDGKPWEHSRAMLRPNFVRDQVSDLDLEETHVQSLIKVMPVQADGWTKETNIQVLFFRLTIDSATEFLFGESVDSQLTEAGLGNAKSKAQQNRELAFTRNFDSAQDHMAQRFRLGDLWWMYNPKEYKENNRVIHEFIEHYVQLALQKPLNNEKAAAEEGPYVFLEELARQTRDPVELRSQMLNILLAGRDTTASLLSWVFHQLLRNQRVFTELRSTVIDTFGTYEDPKEITFANLKGCQYLQNCLNETLRLWPVVPGNSRRSNKATVLPRGGGPDGNSPVLIPANHEVSYSVHVMHRRKDLWGPDAEEFKPERFQGRRPGWEFLPFNGGPRICIGQQFALTEASYVMVRLLQRFDKIEAGAGELEGVVRSRLTLTNCPAKFVTLKLHAAGS